MDIFWGMPAEEHLAWGGLIALYLFLAGISGGAFVTASLTDLFSKKRSAKLIKTGAYIAPVAIILGLGLLVLDLSKPFHFWKLLFYINGNSVMSIGTFIISIFVALAFVYGLLIWAESSSKSAGFGSKLAKFVSRFAALRKPVAMLGTLFAFSTTTYTGFLLAAITANALWSVSFFGLVSVPFLAVLFLVSGLSAGLAATLLGADRSDNVGTYKKIDTVLIVLEIILLAVLYSTVNPLYFSGSMAVLFWVGVVAIGLLLPLILSIYSLYRHSNLLIPVSGMVIIGGLCLRYFIVYSGQLY